MLESMKDLMPLVAHTGVFPSKKKKKRKEKKKTVCIFTRLAG